MRIAVSSDMRAGVAEGLVAKLDSLGHHVIAHGALAKDESEQWAWASERAARDVAEGRADRAIVCCWTGTGASIAANKVRGVRAALCHDAATAAGARRWNDANALAISLRVTAAGQLDEILQAFLGAEPSDAKADRGNVEHVSAIEREQAER